jgi:hypothetical protein
MLAANARDLLTLMLEQSEYLARLDGNLNATEESQLQALRAEADRIRKGGTGATEIVLGAGKVYWADILSYDQVAAAVTISRTTGTVALGTPLLLLQGERDYQVTMTDFGLWQKALATSPGVTLRSYPGLNHLLITGEGKSAPSEYETPGNVAKSVIDDIAAWISGLPGR